MEGIELLRYYNGYVYGYNINSYIYIGRNGGYILWCGPYILEDDYICYNGMGKLEFVDDKLICNYVFEYDDTEAEKWLRESGMVNENDKIIYDKEEYEIINEKYITLDNFFTHGLSDENIDTYVR